MITPSFGLTATERVLPRLALDWTTGLAQPGVDVTRAGVATFFGSDGLVQSASADTQRIDYSTGIAGLLVEEARTNINTYSNGSFVNGSNGYVNSGTLVGTVNAPDGTATAEQFSYSSGVQHNLYKTITCSASTAYTWSFFYSIDTIPDSELLIAIRDDSNGAFIAANITPNKTVLANGYVRASYSFTTPVGCVLVRPYFVRNTFSVSGTISWWGAQLEAGAFPTSYIPTEASAVTRNADVATMTGTNFSDFYNPTEGAFEIEAFSYVDSVTGKFGNAYWVSDGTQNNKFECLASASFGATGWANFGVRENNVSQASISGSAVKGQFNKFCATYKADSFAGSANGTFNGTDTAGVLPTVDRLYLGGTTSTGNFLNGWIRSFRYWPQRITNAETTAFSKKG